MTYVFTSCEYEYTDECSYEVQTDEGGHAVVTEGDVDILPHCDEVIYIPPCQEFIAPIPVVIAEQLLAYHIARLRGCEIDQPRNLAKSVTVE